MIDFLRRALRTFLRLVGRCVFAPLVIAAGRRPDGPEIPVSVHMLVSSKTWRMGLMAALSLEYFSGKRWKLFIHEDGSVDRHSRERIEARLPGVRFVTRKEADEAAGQLLRDHHACLRNRSRHNLFLKFFDPMAFAPGDKFLILDADLFFFRRPEFLLRWAEGSERACYYNRDVKEVYCLPREMIEKEVGVRLWECFNSGLLCICREALDLDLSERLLAAFEATAHHPQFFEQTLYALCASAFNRGGPLPAQYEITWNIFRHRDSVCRHYVGPAKFDHLYFEGPFSLFVYMTLPSLVPFRQRGSRPLMSGRSTVDRRAGGRCRWLWMGSALLVMGLALSAIFAAKSCSRSDERSEVREGAPGVCVRSGLPILKAKLKAGKPVHLAFLGGSITQNAGKNGYVSALPEWIRANYPKSPVRVTNAGLSGTGSDRGAKRVDREVLASNPDLVFVEFAVNDGARDSICDMEQIVRKTLQSNPEAELVFLYTTSDGAFKQTTKGKTPEAIGIHEKVARHYGIASVTLGSDLRKRLLSGESSWGDLFTDACHPTEQGYDSYNRDLIKAFKKILTGGAMGAEKLPDPMPSGGPGAGP